MLQERSAKVRVYTTEPFFVEDAQLMLFLSRCDVPNEACTEKPQYVVLYDLRGIAQNKDGSLELYNVQDVPAIACTESHARDIVCDLMSGSEHNLCSNPRIITVKEWLDKLPKRKE